MDNKYLLYNKINQLNDNKNDHEINKLIEIIRNMGIQYSENSNGLFLNLSMLDDKIIKQLEKYLATPDYKISKKNIVYDLNFYENESKENKINILTENKIIYKDFSLSPLEKKILLFSK
tara:strand:+ start:86 stop:442 length:357 start_codon:yes stop_codon:yes gene_type:complete